MSCSTIIQSAAFGQAADQRDRALGLVLTHAGGRLVQQDDVGAAGYAVMPISSARCSA